MKANRSFRTEDDAVSPVIAVILMVAITVVLAATVYVWVSGFGSQSSNPSKSLALSSAGAIDSTTYTPDFLKKYTVASATSGMRYQDITLTIEGVTAAFDTTSCSALDNPASATAGSWGGCAGATDRIATSTVAAGDQINIRFDSTEAGKTLRILDASANSVIVTLVMG
jgi:flagellin-like protein